MKYWILIPVLFFGFRAAFAADGGAVPVTPNNPQQQKPAPKLIHEKDRYSIDFGDGRVATLFQAVGAVKQVQVLYKQTENTCDFNQTLSLCKLNVDASPYAVYMKWTKHPDPKKLHQILKYTQTSDSNATPEDLNDKSSMFWYVSLHQPEWAGLFKPDQMVCDNLNWAAQIPHQGNRLKIQSWTSEFMLQNQETAVNENQTVGGVFDVEMLQKDNKTLQFDKFGADSNAISNLPPYLGLQTSTVNFQNTDHKVCQVSFQVDLQSAQADLGSPDAQKIIPASEKPLMVGRALKNTNLFFRLQQMLDSSQSSSWRVE